MLRHTHVRAGSACPLSHISAWSLIRSFLDGDPGCADRDVSAAFPGRGGRQALGTIILLLAQVGRSFEYDLSDCWRDTDEVGLD